MSTMVDERVVEMRFDNRQFERNVSTSIETLNKLNKGLAMEGATKGLQSVQRAVDQVDFKQMERTATQAGFQIHDVFLKVATVLEYQIARRLIAIAGNVASAFTIDPVKTGFQEYETQINAVQTILANTSSKGKTLKDVSAALDELNKYADQTIYNFTEMTRNIGTFTAAGVDLDTSVQAIKGIANLAAVSGSTSQQASTAMYQLSQALSSGTVKLQDWNSVVNAGMGGQVFQDALKETARVHGIAIDEMIDKEGSFRETLKTGWLSADILTETLSKFTGDLTEEQLKTMGYTDKQIEGILKMGQTANDAATKVKTFTQLFDTLKEAAQSGWTQSWEIIVGDFEEAKKLLTDISNVLGGFINSVSESRNAMLKGWKDLGGRAVLIEALRNVFEGLMSVIKPIKEAFTDIFPPTTAKQLFGITEGFKKFTERLKLSEEQSATLKSACRALFAALDIGIRAVASLWNVAKPLLKIVGGAIGLIVKLLAACEGWLVNLDETIKKTDAFNNVFKKFADGIKNGAEKVKNFLAPAVEVIKNLAVAVGTKIKAKGLELFGGVLDRVNTRVEETSNKIAGMKNGVSAAFEAMGKTVAGSKFVKLMLVIGEAIKKVALGVSSAIGDMVDDIISGASNANFDRILDTINTVSFGGVAAAISGFFNNLSKPVKDAKGIVANLKSILTSVSTCINDCSKAFTKNLKVDTFKTMATAIAILAASLLVISLIDSNKLATSLIAVSTLFADLLGSMAVFDKIGGTYKGLMKACTAMISMSVAVAILAGAMATLSELDWDGIFKGLAGVAGLTAVVVVAAKKLSASGGKLIKGATSLVVFALAIKMLASACIKLAELNWGELIRGLVGVGALVAAVVAFVKFAKVDGKIMGVATGMLILSAAIKVMASACATLGAMDPTQLLLGLVAILALLAELMLFTRLVGNPVLLLGTSAALVVMGAAIKIFASSVKDLGSLSWDTISNGLRGIAGGLAILAVGTRLLPKNMLVIGAGLLVVGAALAVFTSALTNLGGMSPEDIKQTLIALGIAFVELAIGLRLMSGTIAGSAALIVAAAALAAMTVVLGVLAAMPLAGIAKGLLTIFGAFAVIGIAGAILSPLVPVIVALAASLAAIGVGVLAAGVGITVAATGINALAVGIAALAAAVAGGATAIVAGLTVIVTGLVALIPSVYVAVGKGIIAICEVIAEGIPSICKMITKVLLAIIKAIKDCIPSVVDLIVVLMTELLNVLVEHTPFFIESAVKIIVALLKGLAENIDDVVLAGVDLIMALIDGIVQSIPRMVDAGYKTIIDFCNGLATAIRENNHLLIEAVDNMMIAMFTAIGEWFGHFATVGFDIFGYMADGFMKGVTDKHGDTLESIRKFFDDLVEGVKEFLGIHSPSTVFADIGKNVIQGLINGMGSLFAKAGAKAREIVVGIKNKVVEFASKFKAAGTNLISNVVSGFSSKMQAVKSKATEIISSAKTTISNWTSKFKAAGQSLISNVVSGFSSKMQSIKTKAGEIISTARTTIGNWAERFKTSGRNLVSNVISGFSSMASTVRTKASSIASVAKTAIGNWGSNFRSAARTLISNVVSGFGDKLKSVKEKAIDLASSAKTAIANWRDSFKGVGKNLISGLITGIGEKASSLVKKVKGVVDDAIQAAKNLLGIHSPSKVFAEMGRFVDEGFIVGLQSFAGKVAHATEDVGRGAMDAMSNAISGAAGIIDSDVGGPVIRPVLDLSQIRAGSGTISGLFGQQTVALNGVLGGNIGAIAGLTSQLDKIKQNGNADVVDAITILRGDVADLADAVTKMRIVMDSGTVVGELLPQIDSGLGRKASLSGRGN